MIAPLSASPAPATPSPALREAAKGVEAMFLRQVLAAARQTSLAGDDDVFGSSAGDTFAQLRDARFADIAAEAGTLGLAKMFAGKLAAPER